MYHHNATFKFQKKTKLLNPIGSLQLCPTYLWRWISNPCLKGIFRDKIISGKLKSKWKYQLNLYLLSSISICEVNLYKLWEPIKRGYKDLEHSQTSHKKAESEGYCKGNSCHEVLGLFSVGKFSIKGWPFTIWSDPDCSSTRHLRHWKIVSL